MPLISRRDLTPEELYAGPRPPRRRRWLLMVLALALPILVLAGLYGVFAYDYYSQNVVIARDYAAKLNLPIHTVPEEQRAWLHYQRARVMLQPEPVPKKGDFAYKPGEVNWEATIQYLRRNERALAAIRSAAQVKHLGLLVYEPRLFAAWSGESSTLLWLAQVLRSDCHLAAIENDGWRAAANLTALLRMSVQVRSQLQLAEQLTAFTIEQMSLTACRGLMANHPDLLTEAELSALASQLQILVADGPARLDLRWEKLQFLDETQRCFTDDGNGDGWMTPTRGLEDLQDVLEVLPPWQFVLLPAPLAARFVATRREAAAKFDDCFQRFERHVQIPLWQRGDAADPVSIEMAQADPRYWFVYLFLGSLPQTSDIAEKHTQERDATIAAVALARYRLRHAKWPESLDVLVPDLLPSVPLDRFDGRPLRYRLVNGAPRLYSVAENRIDEGGMLPIETLPIEVARFGIPQARDWVFWPTDHDKPAIRIAGSDPSRQDSSTVSQPPEPPIDDGEPDESQIGPPAADARSDEPTPEN